MEERKEQTKSKEYFESFLNSTTPSTSARWLPKPAWFFYVIIFLEANKMKEMKNQKKNQFKKVKKGTISGFLSCCTKKKKQLKV